MRVSEVGFGIGDARGTEKGGGLPIGKGGEGDARKRRESREFIEGISEREAQSKWTTHVGYAGGGKDTEKQG